MPNYWMKKGAPGRSAASTISSSRPTRRVSYAIVGTGGFVGLAKHDLAIPVTQIDQERDRFVLEGATKDVLKALPEFEYAKG